MTPSRPGAPIGVAPPPAAEVSGRRPSRAPARPAPRAAVHAAAGLLLALGAAGCRTPAVAPAEAEPRAMYQQVANELPRAHWGVGEPPGIVRLSASYKAEGPREEPPPLVANERGFRVVWEHYRPRSAVVPYDAITAVEYGWSLLPNAILAPLLVVPLQAWRVTVVLDDARVPDIRAGIEADAARLEQVAREVGMGGPWSHAQDLKAKLKDDAATWGPGRLALHFDFLSPVPAWLPVAGKARRAAEAFAWAAEQARAPAAGEPR